MAYSKESIACIRVCESLCITTISLVKNKLNVKLKTKNKKISRSMCFENRFISQILVI